MNQPDPQPPITRPSMRYFMPYGQTIIGFVMVALCVALLIAGVQWLLGGGAR